MTRGRFTCLYLVALGLSTSAQEPLVSTKSGPRPHRVSPRQVNGLYRYGRNDFRILALGYHKLKVQFNGEWMTRGGYPNIGEAIGEADIEGKCRHLHFPGYTKCKITMTFLTT